MHLVQTGAPRVKKGTGEDETLPVGGAAILVLLAVLVVETVAAWAGAAEVEGLLVEIEPLERSLFLASCDGTMYREDKLLQTLLNIVQHRRKYY